MFKSKATIAERFTEFDRLNPEVYRRFAQLAHEVRQRGYQRYSAWSLIAVLRWDIDLDTKRIDGFKINNNYIGHYARKLIQAEPQHFTWEFFGLREGTHV